MALPHPHHSNYLRSCMGLFFFSEPAAGSPRRRRPRGSGPPGRVPERSGGLPRNSILTIPTVATRGSQGGEAPLATHPVITRASGICEKQAGRSGGTKDCWFGESKGRDGVQETTCPGTDRVQCSNIASTRNNCPPQRAQLPRRQRQCHTFTSNSHHSSHSQESGSKHRHPLPTTLLHSNYNDNGSNMDNL